MDKNFLGLGITFSAIDNGLSKSLKGISGQMESAKGSMDSLGKAANGAGGKGLFAGLSNGLQTIGLGKIVSELGHIRQSLGDAGSGLNTFAVDIDFLNAKMQTAFTGKEAAEFQSKMIGLYRATGLTADAAGTLAESFGNAGMAMSDIKASLPVVGTLVGKLGMGASEVAGMFSTGVTKLGATGDEMSDLTKQVFKLQKQYKLTNLMEDMPGIVDNVTKNSLKFGRVNTQQAMRSTIEITKMAAAFRKVGLSQDEAKGAALGLNDLFTDMTLSLDKARLGFGMSEELGKMQQALGRVSGKAVGEFNEMIASGASPAEITKYVQSVYKGLEFSPDQQKTLRYGIEQAFGVDVANQLTTFGDQMQKAGAEAEKAGEKMKPPGAEFADFDKKLSGTLKVVENQMKAAEDMVQVMNQLTNKGAYLKSMQQMAKGFDNLTKIISDPNSFLGQIMSKLMMVADLGPLAAFGLGEFTSYAKVLGTLVGPVLQLFGAFNMFKTLLSPFKSLGKIFPFLAKQLGKIPGGGLVKDAFSFLFGAPGRVAGSIGSGFKSVFSGIGKMVRGAGGLVKNVFSFIFGPVGKIASSLWSGFKSVVGSIFKGAGSFFKSVGGLVKNVFSFIFGPVGKASSSLGKGFMGILRGVGSIIMKFLEPIIAIGSKLFGPMAKIGVRVFGKLLIPLIKVFGKSFLAVLGPVGVVIGVVWTLYDVITLLAENWSDLASWVGKFSKDGEAAMRKFGEGVSEVWGVVKDAAGMAWTAIKGWWGDSSITKAIGAVWESIKESAAEAFKFVSEGLKKIGIPVPDLEPFKAAISSMVDYVATAFGRIGDAISRQMAELLAKYPMLDRLASGVGKIHGGIVDGTKAAINYVFGDDKDQPVQPQGAQVIEGTAKFNERREKADAARKEAAKNGASETDAGATKGGTVASDDEPAARATPTRSQRGAAAFASQAGVDLMPTSIQTGYQSQDMKLLAQEISGMRNDLVKLLAAVGDKKIVVELVGDMRKFMQASQAESRKSGSAMSANQAVGG